MEWVKIFAKIFFWLLFIAFWGFCLWVLFLSPLMQVEKINIINDKVDKTEVETRIKQELAGKYLNLIPKKNLILMPQKKIEKRLVNDFRLIKEAEVRRVFPTAILVHITERESLLSWCAQGECFLVDETGEVFYRLSPADPEWSSQELVRIEDKSQKNLAIGTRAIDRRLVDFCQRLPQLSKQILQLEIEKQYTTPSSMSGEIKVRTKAGWEIYFNTNDLLENQIQILKEVLGGKISTEQQAQLEYIDLRLKSRVTYKLKNQEEAHEEE